MTGGLLAIGMVPEELPPRDFILGSSAAPVHPWWSPTLPTRLEIDGVGLRFEFNDGTVWSLRWDDPSLQFTLEDWTAPVTRNSWWNITPEAKKQPYRFGFWRTKLVFTIGITKEAFEAIDASAQAVGICRVDQVPPGKAPLDLRILQFGPGKNR